MTLHRRHGPCRRSRLLLVLLAALAAPLRAEVPPARDLREERFKVPVSLVAPGTDRRSRDMVFTVFHPGGKGPFPVAVLIHGRATSPEKQAVPDTFRFESASRYFVRKGFLVLVPTRVGYGVTGQDFDPEAHGSGPARDYRQTLDAASTQVLAAIGFARRLPDAGPGRVVLVGNSVGGSPRSLPRRGVRKEWWRPSTSPSAREGAPTGIPVPRSPLLSERRSSPSWADRSASPRSRFTPRTTASSGPISAEPGPGPSPGRAGGSTSICRGPSRRTATSSSSRDATSGCPWWTISLAGRASASPASSPVPRPCASPPSTRSTGSLTSGNAAARLYAVDGDVVW